MSNIYKYPGLPPAQKVQLEQKIRGKLFLHSLPELLHLLTTPFPFRQGEQLWLERYCELAQFQGEKGHMDVTDEVLKKWMSRQRVLKRKGKLSSDKQRALNRLKRFSWSPEDDHWQKQYEAYRKYLKGPPSISAGKALRQWIYGQRLRWDRLSGRKKKLLLSLGKSPDPFGNIRMANLLEMEVYFQKHGHLVGLAVRLSQFSRSMRRMQEKGKLDPEIKARLDRMNFNWSISRRTMDFSTLWEHRYAQVAAYLQPTLPHVPPLPEWDDPKLAGWIKWQRNAKYWQSLSPERKQKLRQLNISPGTAHRLEWNRRYQRAVAVAKKIEVPMIRAYKKFDKTVYRWLKGQQEQWKRLSARQRQKLLKLGVNVPVSRKENNPA